MSSFNSEGQASNVRPPRHGSVLALSVDSTARAYDLRSLALGTANAPDDGVTHSRNVFLTMQCDSALHYHFSDGADTDLDDTTVISAGSSLAFSDDHSAILHADQDISVRLDRTVDKYLVVKTATGTATLRFWASSDSE